MTRLTEALFRLGMAAAAGLAVVAIIVLAAPAAPVAAEPPPPDRQVSAPAISFIDSPTAACYQSQTGECYIAWQHFYVDAAPSYMTYLTVTIDGRVRALHSGFFQSAMYIPEGMHGMGFKVPCGGPTDALSAPLGRLHAWQASAQASDGLKSNNYGTVLCPPALYSYLPLIFRPR